MSPRPIIVTGAGGMLGSRFVLAHKAGEVFAFGRDSLDVEKPRALIDRMVALSPAVIINCAADTNVEKAEENPRQAFSVNAILPGLLAQVAREAGALLVHFSSTGCYGLPTGDPLDPHSDFAPLKPTTVHHRSKAAGETAIRESGCRAAILRLGWLYGGDITHQKNFVWARILEARSKPQLQSDPYQIGCPTFIDDVVRQTKLLIENGLTGTFNCVAKGTATRFDYVEKILELAGIAAELKPTRFKRKAPVSPNEAALNEKLSLLGLDMMPHWEEALTAYVKQLLTEEARHERSR